MFKKALRILIFVALASSAVGAWYWWSGSDEAQIVFRTASVTRGDFVSRVQATGTLEPQELVDVGAQVTGEILEFGVDSEGHRIDFGSEVKAGQMLARIDDTKVELSIRRAEASVAQSKAQILSANASVLQAEASIAQATANKEKADRDLERATKLGVGEALSQMSYDAYLSSAQTTAASLMSAKAQLENAKASQAQAAASLQSSEAALASELRNRDYTQIHTPVDGTIIVRQVNVGQTVVSNMNATTLFLVARDLTKMQIWTSVNEADVAKVKAGQPVRYTVDALPNRTFEGVVNKVRPNATMTSNVVTYIVEIDTDNPKREILPYMSANVDFIINEVKDVFLVSDAAFRFQPEEKLIAPAHLAKWKESSATSAAQGGAGTPRGPRGQAGGKGGRGGDSAGPGTKGSRGAAAEGASPNRPVTVWKKEGDFVVPVRVIRGESDGSRSWITLVDGEELKARDELVTSVATISKEASSGAKGGSNPFSAQRPERRQRTTGDGKVVPEAPGGGGPGGGGGGGGGRGGR